MRWIIGDRYRYHNWRCPNLPDKKRSSTKPLNSIFGSGFKRIVKRYQGLAFEHDPFCLGAMLLTELLASGTPQSLCPKAAARRLL